MFNIKTYYARVQGPRNYQQDSFVTHSNTYTAGGTGQPIGCSNHAFGVFDGLGGERNGAEASSAAASLLAVRPNNIVSVERLNNAVRATNGFTTASVLQLTETETNGVHEYTLRFIHAGDSTIVFIPVGSSPVRITEEMNGFGAMRKVGLEGYKYLKSTLDNACLGCNNVATQRQFPEITSPVGTWIFCTDGFSGAYEDENGDLYLPDLMRVINNVLLSSELNGENPNVELQRLAEAAATKTRDNATILVVTVE